MMGWDYFHYCMFALDDFAQNQIMKYNLKNKSEISLFSEQSNCLMFVN